MEGQTKQNQDASSEMLQAGFNAACDSFSFLVGEQHTTDQLVNDFSETEQSTANEFKNDSELYVLSTELQGEVKGKQHLILSADKVNKMTTQFGYGPVSKTDDDSMGRAFLLEICNIVAASAISHFANVTKLNMVGSVPSLMIIDAANKGKFFKELNKVAPDSIQFSTTFSSSDGRKQTICLWEASEQLFKI